MQSGLSFFLTFCLAWLIDSCSWGHQMILAQCRSLRTRFELKVVIIEMHQHVSTRLTFDNDKSRSFTKSVNNYGDSLRLRLFLPFQFLANLFLGKLTHFSVSKMQFAIILSPVQSPNAETNYHWGNSIWHDLLDFPDFSFFMPGRIIFTKVAKENRYFKMIFVLPKFYQFLFRKKFLQN